MKTQHTIKLTGKKIDNSSARLSDEVDHFVGSLPNYDTYFEIKEYPDYVIITTIHGIYTIPFDKVLNIFKGTANGIKVHVSLKKISGKLIYWN